jgi:hypothetical protein
MITVATSRPWAVCISVPTGMKLRGEMHRVEIEQQPHTPSYRP